jgi:hypothetical protein
MVSGLRSRNHNTFITVLLVTLFMMSVFPQAMNAETSMDREWNRAYDDIRNTGFVEGVGNITTLIERFSINETDMLGPEPICVDLEGDGLMELIYITSNATLFIRSAFDGHLIWNLDFGNRSTIPPIATDFNRDGVLDIILVNTSDNKTRIFANNTWINPWRHEYCSYVHFIDGRSREVVKTLTVRSRIKGEGRIYDVDADGRDELILPVYNGRIWCIDLERMKTDWSCPLTAGTHVGNPVAIFEHDGEVKIAVTSGLWGDSYVPVIEIWGCMTLFIIDGSTGIMEKELDKHDRGCVTPPVVIKMADGRTLIAFGDSNNATIIYDYETEEIYFQVLEWAPNFWMHWIKFLTFVDEGTGHNILIQHGTRGCAAIDVDDKRILWKHIYQKPRPGYVRHYGASVCDIDGDGDPELLQIGLRVTHEEPNPVTFHLHIRDAMTGIEKTNLTSEHPNRYGAFILADMDSDGLLEIAIEHHYKIVIYDDGSPLRRPPRISSLEPAYGSIFQEGETIKLHIEVEDPEGKGSPTVTWQLEGTDLSATGPRAMLDGLSVGDHTIIVTVEFPSGLVLERRIHIEVIPPPPYLPNPKPVPIPDPTPDPIPDPGPDPTPDPEPEPTTGPTLVSEPDLSDGVSPSDGSENRIILAIISMAVTIAVSVYVVRFLVKRD